MQTKTFVRQAMLIIAVIGILAAFPATVHAAYVHDPMANPNVAKDIVVDPNAVFGYAPSPNSDRLKEYVNYDWSDPTVVGKIIQEREAYHESLKELYTMISTMKSAGSSVKDIAVAVSTRRNELRLLTYKDDPVGLATLKKSNLENYGNENGGTPEYFYNRYGSWETVLEQALSTNAGADACLGLYDKYYDTYFIAASEDSANSAKTAVTTTPAASGDYTVEKGDCLSGIARKILGDDKQWRLIYDMNADTIKNPNLIYPGQLLKLY